MRQSQNRISVIALNGKPLFFQHRDRQWVPTLRLLHEYPSMMPKMQVDRGAVKFVLRGSNVMCQGLTSPGGRMEDVPANAVVQIAVEGKQHSCAIGITTMSTEDIRRENKGPCIETLTSLGDGLWTRARFFKRGRWICVMHNADLHATVVRFINIMIETTHGDGSRSSLMNLNARGRMHWATSSDIGMAKEWWKACGWEVINVKMWSGKSVFHFELFFSFCLRPKELLLFEKEPKTLKPLLYPAASASIRISSSARGRCKEEGKRGVGATVTARTWPLYFVHPASDQLAAYWCLKCFFAAFCSLSLRPRSLPEDRVAQEDQEQPQPRQSRHRPLSSTPQVSSGLLTIEQKAARVNSNGTRPAHREQQPAAAPAAAAAAAAGAEATAHAEGGGSTMDESVEKEQEAAAWSSAEAERHSTAAATAATESPESYSGGSGANTEEQLQVQQQQQQEDEQQQQEGDESEVEQRINEPSGSSSTKCALCSKAAPGDQQPGDDEWVCEECSSSKQEQQGAPHETHGAPPAQLDESSAALEDTSDPSRSNEGTTGSSEYCAKNQAAIRGSGNSSSSSSTSGGGGVSRGRGSPATSGAQAAAAAAAAAGSRKCIDEGSVRRHVVPVGPKHQVPCLPPFFLESGPTACCCVEGAPVLDASLTAKLVYSPSSLERVRQRRLAEGLADRAICSEGDMEAFMQQCAKNWKANKPGWQPFSPEFAFKLLHYAGYDPEKALQLMEDPQFPFQLVCDGPVRRYDNKWRPKDRRGVISPTPYPPPVFLRGYLSRRHYRDSSGYSLR
ncbi:hypothetical protein Esti_000783 [Eimeria stiedai]